MTPLFFVYIIGTHLYFLMTSNHQTHVDILHEVSQEIERLEFEQAEVESAYERWIVLDKELDRLEGKMQVLSELVG